MGAYSQPCEDGDLRVYRKDKPDQEAVFVLRFVEGNCIRLQRKVDRMNQKAALPSCLPQGYCNSVTTNLRITNGADKYGNEICKLPLDFGALLSEDVENSRLASCTEIESIDQFIEMLIDTAPGEHAFDKEFGCEILS